MTDKCCRKKVKTSSNVTNNHCCREPQHSWLGGEAENTTPALFLFSVNFLLKLMHFQMSLQWIWCITTEIYQSADSLSLIKHISDTRWHDREADVCDLSLSLCQRYSRARRCITALNLQMLSEPLCSVFQKTSLREISLCLFDQHSPVTSPTLTDVCVNNGLLCSGLGDHFTPAEAQQQIIKKHLC